MATTTKQPTRTRTSSAEPAVKAEVEFTAIKRSKPGKLEQRAAKAIDALRKADQPLLKQQIAGQDVAMTGMFAALKHLGLVEEYRASGSKRGVAYEATDALREVKS